MWKKIVEYGCFKCVGFAEKIKMILRNPFFRRFFYFVEVQINAPCPSRIINDKISAYAVHVFVARRGVKLHLPPDTSLRISRDFPSIGLYNRTFNFLLYHSARLKPFCGWYVATYPLQLFR